MLANTQRHILPLVQQRLGLGPATQQEVLLYIEQRLRANVYFWHEDLYDRLQRLIKRGQIIKINLGAKVLYALPEHFPGNFDLTDNTARLVAADYAEEQGQQNIADLLRKATNIVTVAKPSR